MDSKCEEFRGAFVDAATVWVIPIENDKIRSCCKIVLLATAASTLPSEVTEMSLNVNGDIACSSTLDCWWTSIDWLMLRLWAAKPFGFMISLSNVQTKSHSARTFYAIKINNYAAFIMNNVMKFINSYQPLINYSKQTTKESKVNSGWLQPFPLYYLLLDGKMSSAPRFRSNWRCRVTS